MEKENDGYLNLMPEKEEVQESNTGFETDFGNTDSGLEGIPKMDLGIGLTDF